MNTKSTVVLTLALLALAFGPATSSAASISKTIQAPTVFQNTEGFCVPSDASCQKVAMAHHARCAYLHAPTVAQNDDGGVFGYVIQITSVMRGKSFSLSPVPANSADFDIVFYESLGTCENEPGPDTDFLGQRDRYAHFGTGPERGVIPRAMEDEEDETAGARYAIVTVFGATPQAKFSFVY